jgi:hypothetical protein
MRQHVLRNQQDTHDEMSRTCWFVLRLGLMSRIATHLRPLAVNAQRAADLHLAQSVRMLLCKLRL